MLDEIKKLVFKTEGENSEIRTSILRRKTSNTQKKEDEFRRSE